eukprot:796022-Pelagomonas_calceolata.AAC.3
MGASTWFLANPPWRGNARRALPRGASPMVWEIPTSAHTRPLWPTHSTTGSGIWNLTLKLFYRKASRFWEPPVHAEPSSAHCSKKPQLDHLVTMRCASAGHTSWRAKGAAEEVAHPELAAS